MSWLKKYKNDSKINNAQRATEDRYFTDPDAKVEKERMPSGHYVPVTRYSDGSSTVHFGGPCGSQNYDENGEEC